MKRCIECGRPYRGGLSPAALLELALQELTDSDLSAERMTDLTRIRKLVRSASGRIDLGIAEQAERMISAHNLAARETGL